MSKLYKNILPELRQRTGRNIVAWSANNRGNGSRNLHVAELQTGMERARRFKDQTGIIRDGFTSHWAGQCSASRILAALQFARAEGMGE